MRQSHQAEAPRIELVRLWGLDSCLTRRKDLLIRHSWNQVSYGSQETIVCWLIASMLTHSLTWCYYRDHSFGPFDS